MRKITKSIVSAFIGRKPAKSGNTYTDGNALFLHNNKIAEYIHCDLWITNAGWFSKTTKERLNALPGVSINEKAGTWYLNGLPWDGSKTLIREEL